jgi:hypothetical protein
LGTVAHLTEHTDSDVLVGAFELLIDLRVMAPIQFMHGFTAALNGSTCDGPISLPAKPNELTSCGRVLEKLIVAQPLHTRVLH